MFKKNVKRHATNYFKTKTIDYSKYLKEYYVDDNLAYISCNVNNYSEVINDYSVKNYEDLNPRFIAYVEDNAEHIPVEYPIVLEITGKTFNQEEQDTISESVQDYYNMKLGEIQEELAGNFRMSMILLVLGIIFLVLYIIFRNPESNNLFLVIPAWFLLEEFADVFWLERNQIKQKKVDYAQLSSMKVIFREKFVDDDINKETEEKIIKEIFNE